MPRVTYFKRHRMERPLADPPPPARLPDGYSFVPWEPGLTEAHAEVKFASFQGEIDAVVFPSLATREGCSQLMHAIRHKPGFHPLATWLVRGPDGLFVGTIQGVRERGGWGAVQNLGVVPAERGHGLGAALLLKALAGFQAWGQHRAMLEVTARNDGAVRLYRRLGFRCRKTVYKSVEPAEVFI